MDKKFYSVKQVAKIFEVDIEQVYKQIREGKIKAIMFGCQWRISQGEIDRITTEVKRMADESNAILTVGVNLDPDKMNQLTKEGYSDAEIEELIKKSITIKTDSKCPVCDIAEVCLDEYF